MVQTPPSAEPGQDHLGDHRFHKEQQHRSEQDGDRDGRCRGKARQGRPADRLIMQSRADRERGHAGFVPGEGKELLPAVEPIMDDPPQLCCFEKPASCPVVGVAARRGHGDLDAKLVRAMGLAFADALLLRGMQDRPGSALMLPLITHATCPCQKALKTDLPEPGVAIDLTGASGMTRPKRPRSQVRLARLNCLAAHRGMRDRANSPTRA